jgi:peptidoglycan hydrolase CwlO-like protein
LQKENVALSEESKKLHRKLAKATENVELEHAKFVRVEAALEAMSQTIGKPETDNYTAIVNDVQAKLRVDSEDKQNLRSQLHALQLASDQKDSKIDSLKMKATNLEREMHVVRQKLQKTKEEEEAARTKSRTLRHEGRKARSCILEAVTHMWDIVNVARTEAKSAGVEIPSIHTYDSKLALTSANESVSADSVVGLEEALGVPELTKAIEAMGEVAQWIRDSPKSRIELESTIRRLEGDNARLLREISNTEVKCDERVSKLRDEVNKLNEALGVVQRGEASHVQMSRLIANLEQSMKAEQEDKNKALVYASGLKEDAARLEEELHKERTKKLKGVTASASEVSAANMEIESLRKDLAHSAKELKAANHHRAVLRDTIDEVEKQVRQKTDALADTQSVSISMSYMHTDDSESLHRMISRYRARSLAMEELVAIYRAGVLALYADGSTYGAANHAWTDEPDGLGVGWIEREINTVKRSYDEEVRVLEVEVGELHGKLRQSNSFVTELRRRFEENMRAMYKSGRDQGTEGLLEQFEHVSQALESSERAFDSLNQDFMYEKTQGRRRHTSIVSDLTNALKGRDAALSAVQRLEHMCEEAGLGPIGIYDALKADMQGMQHDASADMSAHDVSMERSMSRAGSRLKPRTRWPHRDGPPTRGTPTHTHGTHSTPMKPHTRTDAVGVSSASRSTSKRSHTPTKWDTPLSSASGGSGRDGRDGKEGGVDSREEMELQRERQRLSERIREDRLALAMRNDVKGIASPARAIAYTSAYSPSDIHVGNHVSQTHRLSPSRVRVSHRVKATPLPTSADKKSTPGSVHYPLATIGTGVGKGMLRVKKSERK